MLFLGGTISLTGAYLSSFATDIVTYFVLYCCLNGLGGASLYFVGLICGWEWFPERKGLITGLILGGYGVGAFVFGGISTILVNPNGENPNIYE